MHYINKSSYTPIFNIGKVCGYDCDLAIEIIMVVENA